MIRQPAVAGQFYTGDGTGLKTELAALITPVATQEKVCGVIAPHAGYMYSGAVAGNVYGRIEVPSTVVILGPNHTGSGARTALFPDGEWLTPLGAVAINSRLAELVKKHAPQVEEDSPAHHREHSLEVQVPFLQFVTERCLHSTALSRVQRLRPLPFARPRDCPGNPRIRRRDPDRRQFRHDPLRTGRFRPAEGRPGYRGSAGAEPGRAPPGLPGQGDHHVRSRPGGRHAGCLRWSWAPPRRNSSAMQPAATSPGTTGRWWGMRH